MMDLLITAFATAAVLLAAWGLYWSLNRNATAGPTAGTNETPRGMSRLESSGELLDGSRRRRVSLVVTDSTLYYEGSGTRGSLELESILEVEYDTATSAGLEILSGRALRLRSEAGTIELVLPRDTVTNWYRILPPHPERARPALTSTATPKVAPRTTPLVWHR